MQELTDLTEETFGRLKVLRKDEITNLRKKSPRWLCECKCGIIKSMTPLGLKRTGKNDSCKQCKISLKARWYNIKDRCLNSKNNNYKNYGGRGIKIHDKWLNFEIFYADIKNSIGIPPKNTQIDRINNNGHYEPNNVRWASPIENMRNTRANRNITFNNETKCLTEWSQVLNISARTLAYRLDTLKQPVEKAFIK